MNLERIEKDMDEVLKIGVDERVKRLWAPMSDDEQLKCMSRLMRVCHKFKMYCEFFKAKTFKHPEGKPIKTSDETGRLVRVAPCAKEYNGKTYLGIMIGDAALSSSVSISEDSIVCDWSHYNPAILVPSINKVIYGIESWWSFIEDDEDLIDITDDEINNIWYIRLAKSIAKKDQVGEVD